MGIYGVYIFKASEGYKPPCGGSSIESKQTYSLGDSCRQGDPSCDSYGAEGDSRPGYHCNSSKALCSLIRVPYCINYYRYCPGVVCASCGGEGSL